MTGQHGCGSWKRAKTSKSFYKRLFNQDTGKWYTVTSTKTQPKRTRGTFKTWYGAMQRGANVYLNGGRYSGVRFIYMGTGHGTGDDSYKVYGLDGTQQTREMLEYFGVPYNKVWTEGTGVYGIKVPGGVLLDKGWPWSTKLGYPTKYKTEYWIWTEGWASERITDQETWENWYEYLDILAELTAADKELLKKEMLKDFIKNEGGNQSIVVQSINATSSTDFNGTVDQLKDFGDSNDWFIRQQAQAEKKSMEDMWDNMWGMIEYNARLFNEIWWRKWDIYG